MISTTRRFRRNLKRKIERGMIPISASTETGSHPRVSVLEEPPAGHVERELPDSRPASQDRRPLAAHSRPESKVRHSSASIRSIALKGPAGRLEAVLNQGSSDAPFAALVCHPHPVFGGTLHNKVVYHAMKALNDPVWGFGWPVLRFNFRGAGLSEGAHDGEAEVGDVLAALDWLKNKFQLPLILVGFSFGAAMALRAVSTLDQTRTSSPACPDVRDLSVPDIDVRALIALGLPIEVRGYAYRYSFLRNLSIPKLFVSGDRDQFAPSAELSAIASTAAEPKRLIVIPGADHFFSGQLEPMQQAIASWLKEQIQ
jgi:alpha/beta superfamily hydrolase